jgi:hypothetical protein
MVNFEFRGPEDTMTQMIARLTEKGTSRVLNGAAGMTFIVDEITEGVGCRRIAHVRDYRYANKDLGREFQIWSLGPEGYQLVTP